MGMKNKVDVSETGLDGIGPKGAIDEEGNIANLQSGT